MVEGELHAFRVEEAVFPAIAHSDPIIAVILETLVMKAGIHQAALRMIAMVMTGPSFVPRAITGEGRVVLQMEQYAPLATMMTVPEIV